MFEGSYQHSDDGNDCQHRCGDSAERSAQLSEDASACFYCNTEFLHAGRQLHEPLHRHANLGNQSSDDDQERAKRSHDKTDG